MVYIVEAKYLKNYEIWIASSDGSYKVVDLASEIDSDGREPMKQLKILEYFKTFVYDPQTVTICWDNGVDFDPGYLYKIGKIVHNEHGIAS